MIIELLVKVNIEHLEGKRLKRKEASESVRDALNEALNAAQNRGFNHPLGDETGIHIESVEIK